MATKTKAVRLYGKEDLRLEEFELPEIKDDEILAHIVSDSICMSSYKAAIQGSNHKRVPADIAENPIIIGHEFCGEIVKVGKKWQGKYKEGERFTIQPALDGRLETPGYAYPNIGGSATYVIIPGLFVELDSLLHYDGDAFFYGSLAEPMSCIVGGFHANYHIKSGSYIHEMGTKKGGNIAILAGAGPMGLGAIDYAIHCDNKPSLIVVTDINDERLARAAEILSPEVAAKEGVTLKYINTANMADPTAELMALTDGEGYNDVFVYAPVKPVVEMGDALLARDGCLNFFAGPTDPKFSANFNFYNVHYAATHIAGNSGGTKDDMIESIEMMQSGKIDPAAMVTHIGGLNAVAETTLNLPKIPGGKKLIYTCIDLELTALDDFEKLGETNPMFKELARIVKANKGLWCAEAEKYLLANAKAI